MMKRVENKRMKCARDWREEMGLRNLQSEWRIWWGSKFILYTDTVEKNKDTFSSIKK